MRARHRHFNAAHCGGDLLLDSRYLALNNNDAVSSWTNRANSSNNAAQATAANQPTYQTNQLNGNPAVSFDGSDDFVSWTAATVKFALAVCERTGTQTQYGALFGSTVGIRHIFGASNRWAESAFGGDAWGNSTWTSNGTSLAPYTNDSFSSTAAIVTILLTTSSTSVGQTRERTFSNRVPFARIYQLFTSQSDFGSAVTKRIRHASAYSFKISCN